MASRTRTRREWLNSNGKASSIFVEHWTLKRSNGQLDSVANRLALFYFEKMSTDTHTQIHTQIQLQKYEDKEGGQRGPPPSSC